MKQTRILMNMPITIEIVDKNILKEDIDKIFNYFKKIEGKFSVFQKTSEISQINRGEINEGKYSSEMQTILTLAKDTKKETAEYFDITTKEGKLNPSGLVKGWAINQAKDLLISMGYKNFYLEVGGDIQVQGKNEENQDWQIGIRNPFNLTEIIKVITLNGNKGIATSGTYIRGDHIYNPKNKHQPVNEIISFSVIAPNIFKADCMATSAFAMGDQGIMFIENLPEFEGYMVDKDKIATMTTGFEKYVANNL